MTEDSRQEAENTDEGAPSDSTIPANVDPLEFLAAVLHIDPADAEKARDAAAERTNKDR